MRVAVSPLARGTAVDESAWVPSGMVGGRSNQTDHAASVDHAEANQRFHPFPYR